MLREVKVFKNLPKSSVKPSDFLNLKIDSSGDASGRAMAVGQSGPDSNPVGSPGLKLAAFYFVLDGFDQFELKVELFLNNSVRATIL